MSNEAMNDVTKKKMDDAQDSLAYQLDTLRKNATRLVSAAERDEAAATDIAQLMVDYVKKQTRVGGD